MTGATGESLTIASSSLILSSLFPVVTRLSLLLSRVRYGEQATPAPARCPSAFYVGRSGTMGPQNDA